jgi:hypothetical protein
MDVGHQKMDLCSLHLIVSVPLVKIAAMQYPAAAHTPAIIAAEKAPAK